MKWQNLRRSRNVVDHRGGGGSGIARGGLGIGGLALVLVGSWIFGVNPLTVLSMLEGGSSQNQITTQAQNPPQGDQGSDFVQAILGDLEDTWNQKLLPNRYRAPKLVLFQNSTQSGCGFASAAVGPFYCPANQQVYLDLAFFKDLRTTYQAGGDFAEAYVIAHEVGHHVQTLLGTSQQVRNQQQRMSKAESNKLSVALELQADCYAGLWGHYAAQRGLLEEGDLEEALRTAAQIGDDRLQKRSQGYVVPESFTHGSAAQRTRWFKQGFQSGQLNVCNTFD